MGTQPAKRPRAASDAPDHQTAPPAKRAAAATDYVIPFPPGEDEVRKLTAIIQSLPLAKLQNILIQSLNDAPQIPERVRKADDERRHREHELVRNFNEYRKDVWLELRESDDGWEAASAVEKNLKGILRNTFPYSSYRTKKYAVTAMCDIFEWALATGEYVGSVLRQNMEELPQYFLQAHKIFEVDEIERLVTDNNHAWVAKVRALVNLASEYGVLEDLQDVLDLLEVEEYMTAAAESCDEEGKEEEDDDDDNPENGDEAAAKE